jgi:hypothetical protein
MRPGRGRRCARASGSRCALVARALPSYEFVLYNLYKKCTNWYKHHIKNVRIGTNIKLCTNSYYTICITIVWIRLYEFVQKLVKKRFASGLGFQPGTNMACNRCSAHTTATLPPPLVAILCIYLTIRPPSEKVDCTNSFVLHIVIPYGRASK